MTSFFSKRLERLQATLKRKKISAFLVTNPANRRYLSGYTAPDHGIEETAGVLLIPAKGPPLLLTDSRYMLQAEEETEGFSVRLYPKGLIKSLEKLLLEFGMKKLGFESHYILHSTANKLGKMAERIKVELVPLTGIIERQREIKSTEEIERIRKAVLLNEKVFQKVYPTIKPGISEGKIALAIENSMYRMGAERPSFETIVAFGTNAAKPHAVPGKRTLKKGETVLIDMGLVLDGYCSDMTRTFVVGKPNRLFINRLKVVRRAQLAAMKVIRSGISSREVDMAARNVIRQSGYGDNFGHALGHGVGVGVHEEPRLSSHSRRKLKSGMVVTVEPGIYLPEWGGIRLENMVVVRDKGCELLNKDTTFLDL
jgi:Xaa-Pro aminopeptidase